MTFFVLQWNLIIGQNSTRESLLSNGTDNEDRFVPMNIHHEPLTSLICEKRVKPYFIPHPSEFSRFYVCVKGQLFLLNCPSNYRFDSEADQCIRQMIENTTIPESKEQLFSVIHSFISSI